MNAAQIVNLILSTDAAAKDFLKQLIKKSPPTDQKYIYMRCLQKSVLESKKYFQEYEKIIRLLFDEEAPYTVEFTNYINQFLKTLCAQVSSYC